MQVTLDLTEQNVGFVQQWATLTQQPFTAALNDMLSAALPFTESVVDETAISQLSNEEIVTLTTVKMPQAQGKRLDVLMARQREGQLTSQTKRELLNLMNIYHQLWIRQAQALAESVKRGLLPPMNQNNGSSH